MDSVLQGLRSEYSYVLLLFNTTRRARTHTEYVRAQPAQRAEARARARAEFPKSIHTQASLKPFFAIPAGTPP